LQIGLGLPFEVAEEMKKKYGSALPVYEGTADNDSIAQERAQHFISRVGAILSVIVWKKSERLIILELPRG